MNPDYRQGQQLNPGNPQNEASVRTMRTFNTFPMSYKHGLTARYGDVTPFYCFEAEAGDKVPFASFHELISPTLKGLNMTDIRMIKDYFSVPMRAILPNTWDLFYTPPTQGDDVPDDVAPYINLLDAVVSSDKFDYFNLWKLDSTDLESVYNSLKGMPSASSQLLTLMWRSYYINECIFDSGSLLSLLGCKIGKYYGNVVEAELDLWKNDSSLFYSFLRTVFDSYFGDNPNGSIYIKTLDINNKLLIKSRQFYSSFEVQFRRVVEFLKDHSDSYFDISGLTIEHIKVARQFPVDYVPVGAPYLESLPQNLPINLSRVVAYQLSYFHYMTNDKVDFVFSSDIYRNVMKGFYLKTIGPADPYLASQYLSFDYNGLNYEYDVFSNKVLKNMFMIGNYYGAVNNEDIDHNLKYYYLHELLSLRKSLKYGDYFTGSRPRPYAVGDVNAPVVGSSVSALDITRNILMQRFLNAVNKTGRKISEYMKEIRGVNIMPDNDSPKFLARDTVNLGQQEVENTSSQNQGKIVGVLRAQQSKFAFEAEISEPAIILGVVSFDISRFYSQTIDRQFFITNRYEMFQPYMQNIGDQEIYRAEKFLGGLQPFAYTLRHMEYKQRFDVVSGGYVSDLPDLIFVADSIGSDDRNYDYLTPDFIRSHNTDLDNFFSILEGVSPSEYYHFRIKFHNISSPNRNMEYSPTIL